MKAATDVEPEKPRGWLSVTSGGRYILWPH